MCYTGIVYAAAIDSITLTFQASGSLWQDALVMQDMETNSLWSQVTGECIQGELKGKVLEPFSSIHTTYSEFKELYPAGLLLKKPQKGPKGSPYEGYFADPDKLGIFGRQDDFRKLDGKDLVFGLRLDGKQVAIYRNYIAEKQYALLENGGAPILVYYDGISNTVAAYELNGDIELLGDIEFDDEKIMLNDLVWDVRTGEALSANTADLRHFPIITAYWFAWFSFYPETELKK